MANMSPKKNPMPTQAPEVRAHNFDEVALGYTEAQAIDEANRCLKCKVPRCKKNCPISTDIPTIMNLFLGGKEREAGRVLFDNNPLSAICSIVCPHENNCYGNCVLGIKKDPIPFYKIEQYISNNYINEFETQLPWLWEQL